jgi:hypothetical protein
VWQATASAVGPQAGSIGPTVGQAGVRFIIAGKGFGGARGSVLFGSTAASIVSWSDTQVTFNVPGVVPGVYNVQLKNSGGTAANVIQFKVLTARLVPVTFTVNNAIQTNVGDFIFLTGSTVELGNWGTTFDTAIGPMLDPNFPNWFLNVSVPAGQKHPIQVHQDRSRRDCNLGKRQQPHVYGSYERNRICECELAVLTDSRNTVFLRRVKEQAYIKRPQ